MKQLVLELIKQMTKEKQEQNKSPDHVLYLDLIRKVSQLIKEVLIELRNEKKIKTGDTLNDKYIRLIPENEN